MSSSIVRHLVAAEGGRTGGRSSTRCQSTIFRANCTEYTTLCFFALNHEITQPLPLVLDPGAASNIRPFEQLERPLELRSSNKELRAWLQIVHNQSQIWREVLVPVHDCHEDALEYHVVAIAGMIRLGQRKVDQALNRLRDIDRIWQGR